MKRCITLAATALAAVGVLGADAGISASAEATLASAYVWRGLNLVDNPVFQPSVTLGSQGWSLSAWGNVELTNLNSGAYTIHSDPEGAFTEVDLTLEYSLDLPLVSLAAGIIDYQFPGQGLNRTQELYVSAGLDAPFSPAATL
jgi:hypothetical protein